MKNCLLIFSLLYTAMLIGQAIPQYSSLDSLGQIGKRRALSPAQINARDSLRDVAHDYADSLIDHYDTRSHFELGVDVESRQIYTGRRGAADGAVGSPSLKYIHKSGIYALLNLDIYSLKYTQIKRRPLKVDTITKLYADVTPQIGFERTFFEKWDVAASYDYTLINYGKNKGLLANSINIGSGFDFWDYLHAGAAYSFYFGGSTDSANGITNADTRSHILNFELSKDFRLYRCLGSTIFTIEPIVSVDVGNDNFTRSRILARNINGDAAVLPATRDDFFGLLDFQATLNLDYRIKNLNISLVPQLIVPFNIVPLRATNPESYRHNQVDNLQFVIGVSARYIFRFWR